MATLAEPVDRRVAARRTRIFLWLTIVCAVIAIGGFMPTYWLQLPAGTFVGPPLLHIHGALATAWILYLISQAWLVSENRLRSHREWGLLGISLATAVFVVGVIAAINGLDVRLARGEGDPARAFYIVPLFAILRFAIFTGAAIALNRKSEWHKRFMIVGTVALIEAAAARIGFILAVGGGPGVRPGLMPPPPDMVVVTVGLLLQLIIVAGMIHDKRHRGAVHPAWWIGLIFGVVAILGHGPLSHTDGWLAFADWSAHIAG